MRDSPGLKKHQHQTSNTNNDPHKVRTNNNLRKQAEFINRLKEGDIWSNVIIIVKQSVNPKYDARGALAAMQDFADTSKVSVVGYRYLSDQAFSEKQREIILSDSSVREVMNVMTDVEIRDILNNKIRNIQAPVRIIFRESVCSDCGEEGDPRLMSEWCHMAPRLTHPGPPEPRHPGGLSRHHPTDRVCRVHPGEVGVGRCGRLCGCGPCSSPRYSCCGRRENTEGCRQVLSCCRNLPSAPGCQSRYQCCGVELASGVRGCTNIHQCCGHLEVSQSSQSSLLTASSLLSRSRAGPRPGVGLSAGSAGRSGAARRGNVSRKITTLSVNKILIYNTSHQLLPV